MSSTAKCWLIANFEIILFLITVLVSIIFWIIIAVDFESGIMGSLVFGGILAIFNIPTKKGTVQYGKFIMMLVFIFLLMAGTPEDLEFREFRRIMILNFWITFFFASVIAGELAHFTYHNIHEVVSRRWLFRHSNAELFEHTWKYTLDRFCNITTSIVSCLLYVRFIVVLSMNGNTFMELIKAIISNN